MSDADGPVIAKAVYEALFVDKHEFLESDCVPRALNAAVRSLRDGLSVRTTCAAQSRFRARAVARRSRTWRSRLRRFMFKNSLKFPVALRLFLMLSLSHIACNIPRVLHYTFLPGVLSGTQHASTFNTTGNIIFPCPSILSFASK